MLQRTMFRLRALLRIRAAEREIDEELQFHIERQAELYIRQGMAPDEARRRARIEFGGVEQVKEECREARGWALVESFGQDVRYAARVLAKSPGFTAVAVLSLALGIGANTAIFSLLDTAMFQTLPVKHPEQLVSFVVRMQPYGWRSNVPAEYFEEAARSPRGFSGVFAFDRSWMMVRTDGGSERVMGQLVSGQFYATLGEHAFLGRAISAEDDRDADRALVAVLSYSYWVRRFGGDPAVLGRNIFVNSRPATIIGVTAPGFVAAERGFSPDVTIPLGKPQPRFEVWAMARLKPGVTADQAGAEADEAYQRVLEMIRPRLKNYRASEREHILSERGGVMRDDKGGGLHALQHYAEPLPVLLGLAGLVLLIGCANIANLLLARSAARASEIGLRLAIGAGRARLVRQLLTESALLSAAGGILGVCFAFWAHHGLVALLMDESSASALDFTLDLHVLAFTAGVSILTTLLFGLAPAIRSTRVEVVSALKREGRRGGRLRLGTAKALIVAQVTASLLLLVGAGLLVRTLRNLYTLDAGFNPESVLLMSADAEQGGYKGAQIPALHRELIRRVEAIPGVVSASTANNVVFGAGGWNKTVWVQGRPAEEKQHADDNVVGPGFFRTVGVPLLLGREFTLQDSAEAPKVAIVNEAFARRYWPGENPIGRRFGDMGAASAGKYEVIGVVKDAKYGSLRERARPTVYNALLQTGDDERVVLHVRTRGNPALMISRLREEIRAINKNLPVFDVRTLDDQVDRSLRRDRMMAALSGFFGLLALLLTAVGLYGVIAYGVARRTSEIGIRIALGASRSALLTMVVRETLLLVVAGACLGVPVALASTGVLKKMLFGITPTDPLTVTGAVVVLVMVGAAAGFVPARRAAALDPSAALRCE